MTQLSRRFCKFLFPLVCQAFALLCLALLFTGLLRSFYDRKKFLFHFRGLVGSGAAAERWTDTGTSQVMSSDFKSLQKATKGVIKCTHKSQRQTEKCEKMSVKIYEDFLFQIERQERKF